MSFESDPGADARGDSRLRVESRELAWQDGRTEARDADRAQASFNVIRESDAAAQEIPTGAEGLVTWDVSPDDAGHRIEEANADDEADVGARMAEQGRNDADRDLRRAAHLSKD